MNMAKAAVKLFEGNLRYSNGEPVKGVISDMTIGRVVESVACAEWFRKAGLDIALTVPPCLCYEFLYRMPNVNNELYVSNDIRV